MDTTFTPAGSLSEASARMFSLTRTPDTGTRGPKRALVALAQSLGLDVDLSATNAVLGGEIASALMTRWRPGVDYQGLQVTLAGMNTLLEAATRELWRLVDSWTVDDASARRVLLALPNFRPASTKLEAVNRISDLTQSGPEMLGPGGKEHKSVLTNLAAAVDPSLDTSRTKQGLAEDLCQKFNVPWLKTAGSTGQTITLEGLNLILGGAERYFVRDSAAWATPADEAQALLSVLSRGLERFWDGRRMVKGMRESESASWRQMEWPGFYFEEQVQWLLNAAFPTPTLGGPRRKYGNTTFDYASTTRVWDTKAHTAHKLHSPEGRREAAPATAVLNDVRAMRNCVQEQGLGLLILDGLATYDTTGSFDEWHRQYTREGKAKPAQRANGGSSRRRKAAFAPLRLQAFWIADGTSLDAGIAGGWILQSKQGRQAARGDAEFGAARADKFHLKVNRAVPWRVALSEWPATHS